MEKDLRKCARAAKTAGCGLNQTQFKFQSRRPGLFLWTSPDTQLKLEPPFYCFLLVNKLAISFVAEMWFILAWVCGRVTRVTIISKSALIKLNWSILRNLQLSKAHLFISWYGGRADQNAIDLGDTNWSVPLNTMKWLKLFYYSEHMNVASHLTQVRQCENIKFPVQSKDFIFRKCPFNCYN